MTLRGTDLVGSALASALLALLAFGCGDRPTLEGGEGCDLNSDCAPPFVCRLDRCRIECAGSRDCPIGSLCVTDADGVGSCRLDDETECELDSDCPSPLVCRSAACTNECLTDDDCPAGSLCADDPSADGAGCFDPAETECRQPSDCPPDLSCTPDGRCRQECREDRDCRDGASCQATTGLSMCVPQ